MPAFYILAFLGIIFLWFLLGFLFTPLGKYIKKLLTDTKKIVDKEDDEE